MHGKRIVLTRPIHQARSWARRLTKLGARPVLYPVIAIAPPRDTDPLREALSRLTAGKFDWLVFSSANAVVAAGRMLADTRCALPDGVRIAAVGPATSAAVKKEWGRGVDFIAPEPNGACLGRTLPLRPNDSVLLPQALQARPHLAEILARRAGGLRVVTAYRTVPRRPKRDFREVLRYPGADCVCFASPSSVNAFLDLFVPHERAKLLSGVDIACLGNVTARAAEQRGLRVHMHCDGVTFSALLQVLRERYG
ncbi:MAG: uroporphyrinogen-III synthase [Myxococcota bacterium]